MRCDAVRAGARQSKVQGQSLEQSGNLEVEGTLHSGAESRAPGRRVDVTEEGLGFPASRIQAVALSIAS